MKGKKVRQMPKSQDIRFLLQQAEYNSTRLDNAIADALSWSRSIPVPKFTSDYNFTFQFLERMQCDWIVYNVNEHMGGTPCACVGCPEDKASCAATPLISLWLSYFRLILGDERETEGMC